MSSLLKYMPLEDWLQVETYLGQRCGESCDVSQATLGKRL